MHVCILTIENYSEDPVTYMYIIAHCAKTHQLCVGQARYICNCYWKIGSHFRCRQFAVGTLMGEVLLYACSSESGPCPGLQLTQRLQCCGSAVTCTTWMDSGKCVSLLDSLSKCGGMYIHVCTRGWEMDVACVLVWEVVVNCQSKACHIPEGVHLTKFHQHSHVLSLF